ncbi:MAG: 2-oxoacid:acceptor oxidoreductase subunit alpha [Anaerolineae bacterium]|nr:2-oxoacid:acceptor oxidoreductase subunit alpha [Anaerolineae bacterium]
MEKCDDTVVIRIGGEGGEGTITLGDIFTRIAARSGLEVYSFRTYPAEIQGGQVLYQVRLGLDRVLSQGDEANVLVALNKSAWNEGSIDMCPHSALIYEASIELPISSRYRYPIPAEEIARANDWPRGKNFVLLGALLWFFRMDMVCSNTMVSQSMRRHPESLKKNLNVMQKGYDYAREHFPGTFPYTLPLPQTVEERIILSGADAMALGALMGGCKFYSGYPITPASPVMESLAKHLPAFGGTFVQAEDEIAAINMAIGASFAGQKAMTATSGPGLSLMIEALGLASMVETPLVLVNVQRAGPSTGLPTKTSQGDLFLSLYGGHGDAPRFVLAPDSVKDCYFQMIYAFYLAEHFQMPVIVLTDQAITSRMTTTPMPGLPWNGPLARLYPSARELAGDFRRYLRTPSGVSPMSEPGMKGGIYLADSLEHDEYGHPDQSPINHQLMMKKRAAKIESARVMLADWRMTSRRWGDHGAQFGIIGWGSTRGAVREATQMLQLQGVPIEAIYPHTLLPMPDKAIRDFISTKYAILVPELNFSGQFGRMIEHRYFHDLDEHNVHVHQLKKEQGVPFKIQEIYNAVLDMIDEERHLWIKHHGDLDRVFNTVRLIRQGE